MRQRSYNYWLALGSMVVLLLLLLGSSPAEPHRRLPAGDPRRRGRGTRRSASACSPARASCSCSRASGAAWPERSTWQRTSPSSRAPTSASSCTAYMMFMALVGGLGTFEGPLIGAIVFFFIDDRFGNANYGVWYLVGLGVVAILFALFLPRGIWGTIEDRFGIRLLPVGYRLAGSPLGCAHARCETGGRLRHMTTTFVIEHRKEHGMSTTTVAEYRHFIAGEWTDAGSGTDLRRQRPVHGRRRRAGRGGDARGRRAARSRRRRPRSRSGRRRLPPCVRASSSRRRTSSRAAATRSCPCSRARRAARSGSGCSRWASRRVSCARPPARPIRRWAR